MSQQTYIHFYPADPSFAPSEEQFRKILDELGVTRFDVVSGETGKPWIGLGGGIFQPPEPLFWEQDVSVEDGIQLWRHHGAPITHFMPPHDGRLEQWSDAMERDFPPGMTEEVILWESSFTFGKSRVDQPETTRKIADGIFNFSKSGDGLPRKHAEYLQIFSDHQNSRDLIDFLTELTGKAWLTVIELSY